MTPKVGQTVFVWQRGDEFALVSGGHEEPLIYAASLIHDTTEGEHSALYQVTPRDGRRKVTVAFARKVITEWMERKGKVPRCPDAWINAVELVRR